MRIPITLLFAAVLGLSAASAALADSTPAVPVPTLTVTGTAVNSSVPDLAPKSLCGMTRLALIHI